MRRGVWGVQNVEIKTKTYERELPLWVETLRVLFLLKEKRAINAKSVLPLPFYVFLSFDSCNSFSTSFLVCFLRV